MTGAHAGRALSCETIATGAPIAVAEEDRKYVALGIAGLKVEPKKNGEKKPVVASQP